MQNNGLLGNINPFLASPKTGGSTTPQFSPTQNNLNLNTLPTNSNPQGAGIGMQSAPTSTGINFGTLGQPAKYPGATGMQQNNNLPPGMAKPQSSSAPQTSPTQPPNTQIQLPDPNGTSSNIFAYGGNVINSQTGQATPYGTQPPGLNNSTQPPQPQGGVGIKAPPGQEYGPDGKLRPIPTDIQNQLQNQNQSQNPQYNPYTNTGAPPFGGSVGALSTQASQPSQAFLDAQKAYQQAAANLQATQADYANQTKLIQGGRTNLSEAGGQQGLLNNAFNQQQASYAGQETAAATQAQAASGQQNVQLGGLERAAGLLQPQFLGPTQVPYYPGTGQYGQPSYGAFGSGGLGTVGGIGTQIQQGAQVQQMTGQQSQAQALAQNLGSLIDSAGINPTAGASVLNTWANGVTQWIENKTGDPKYQNFANLINEISSRYAAILNQSGGTPTDQSTISHSIINGLASGSDIKTVLASLDKNATDSINALRGTSQTNAVGGSSQNQSPNSGGSPVNAGGYNFVQNANGQWVPK